MDMQSCLRKLIELEGSDLYIAASAVPMVRVEGKISPLSDTELDNDEATKLIYSILKDSQIKEFEQVLDLNLALHLNSIVRFRVNVFKQRIGISICEDYTPE